MSEAGARGAPRLLGGRYEVGGELGRGGMAEVHVARDTRLGRTVAVKLLRPDLARDPSFQARFRREAQSAAALNHPSVVAVYDTGEDVHPEPGGGQVVLPYIVMEYVEGRTLRDILRSGQPLSLEEALGITEGVLGALEYSHRMGIVHRDIKPANVMVTPAGEIKVMDFGIARAISDSSATLTQTSAVMGTAQYLSPEQARGEQVDARSDVYSTGCLLYEILTGRPPFVGEAAVAVAYQHVSEQPKPPSTLAPQIPPAVDQVVLMALSKDRSHRYQSAADFADDLRRAVEGRPLRGAAVAGAAGAGAAGATRRFEPVATPPPAAGPTTAMPVVTPAGPPTGAVPVPGDGMPPEQRRARWPWALLALLLVGAGAVAAVLMNQPQDPGTQEPPPPVTVAVPQVVGLDREAARVALEQAQLVPEFSEEPSTDVPQNQVISTDPEADTEVEVGTEVEVLVSTGPELVEVPDVSGQSQEDAIRTLEEAGLNVTGTERTDEMPRAEPDTVVGTRPEEGEEVPQGTDVVLVVASGQVTVPDVLGLDGRTATQRLNALGLTVNTSERETAEAEPGAVLEQSVPADSTVAVGTAVGLVVAREPEEPEPTEQPTREPTASPSTSSPTTGSPTPSQGTGQAGRSVQPPTPRGRETPPGRDESPEPEPTEDR